MVNKAFLYVAGVIIAALVTANVLQWVEIRSLESDLAAAVKEKTLADVNVVTMTAEVERMNGIIKYLETTAEDLESARKAAQAKVAQQRKSHEAEVAAIRADLAKTPEEIRLKMIRNATR